MLALCLCLGAPVMASGQSADPPSPDTTPATTAVSAAPADHFWAPFVQSPKDFKRFVSVDSLRLLAPVAVGALAIAQLDHGGIAMAQSQWQPATFFRAGNVGGGLYAQTGGALALYAIGRWTDAPALAALGSDLVRAQMLTQGTVQAAKFVSRRQRPDSSDQFSLPSGHTAGTFATATVLHRRYGWKAGVPAYAAGVYVAASRMAVNKHHLSDVLMGAAFGIAAGRTVTVKAANQRFVVGVLPTGGGAAVTVTRH